MTLGFNFFEENGRKSPKTETITLTLGALFTPRGQSAKFPISQGRTYVIKGDLRGQFFSP
jgi:hypothetical protein